VGRGSGTRVEPAGPVVFLSMKLGRWITRTRLSWKPPFIASGQIFYERGQRGLDRGDLLAAIAGFGRAADVVQTWSEPCRQLGDLALRLRQPEDAVAWYAEACRRAPEDAQLHSRRLAALLLCNPSECARFLDTTADRLPSIQNGPHASWRSDVVVPFPLPGVVPTDQPTSPGAKTVTNATAVATTLELAARQWGIDGTKEAPRSVYRAIHQWRQRMAKAGTPRLRLDPEWISNIGQLGLIGVLAKLARLGLLKDQQPLLPA